MALPPKFAGQAINSSTIPPKPAHTIEIYLDYVCPFSAKMWKTLQSSIFPQLPKKYPDKVNFLFRQQIQPWHPSSTLVHEAAAAVLQVAPTKFMQFSTALFDNQKDYFDVNVVNEPRNKTYGRLADLAGSVGVDRSKILSLLQVPDKPAEDGSLNVGNGVTNDIKLMVKVGHACPALLLWSPILTGF